MYQCLLYFIHLVGRGLGNNFLKVGSGGFFRVFYLIQDSKLPLHVFVFKICFNINQGFKICDKTKLPYIIRQFLDLIFILHAYRRYIVYTYYIILFDLKNYQAVYRYQCFQNSLFSL